MASQEESRSHLAKAEVIKDWAQRHGVKRFLLDMDDTITSTLPAFLGQQNELYELLSRDVGMFPVAEWKNLFEDIDHGLFDALGVQPTRMGYSLDIMQHEQNISEQVAREGKSILAKTYSEPLEFLEGAEEGLKVLKQTGIPFSIVTHADYDWTMRKYACLVLIDLLIEKMSLR